MDQVSRPMQIALVAVVLLAGMWFTVLRPKPDAGASAPVPVQAAPGVKGLTRAVDAAKGAAAKAGGTAAAAAKPSAAKAAAPATAAPKAAKPAAAKTHKPAAKPAANAPAATAAVDPSRALLRFVAQGKTVVLLFHGDGAEDRAARKAVHRVALHDKRVVSAYAPISRVGAYEAITSGVQVLTTPTVLVIGKDRKAISLTGFVDAGVVRQAVGDTRRAK